MLPRRCFLLFYHLEVWKPFLRILQTWNTFCSRINMFYKETANLKICFPLLQIIKFSVLKSVCKCFWTWSGDLKLKKKKTFCRRFINIYKYYSWGISHLCEWIGDFDNQSLIEEEIKLFAEDIHTTLIIKVRLEK